MGFYDAATKDFERDGQSRVRDQKLADAAQQDSSVKSYRSDSDRMHLQEQVKL
jgi:hypothetical protein